MPTPFPYWEPSTGPSPQMCPTSTGQRGGTKVPPEGTLPALFHLLLTRTSRPLPAKPISRRPAPSLSRCQGLFLPRGRDRLGPSSFVTLLSARFSSLSEQQHNNPVYQRLLPVLPEDATGDSAESPAEPAADIRGQEAPAAFTICCLGPITFTIPRKTLNYLKSITSPSHLA